MPNKDYGPVEIQNAEVVEVRQREQFPGQRRGYNYVVRFTATHIDTGEPVYVNEYRSIASNQPLSNESVLSRFVELIEGIE